MDTGAQSWAEEDDENREDTGTGPASILADLCSALTKKPVSATPVLPPQIPSASALKLYTSLNNDGQTLPEVTSHLLTAITPYLNASSLSPHYYGFVTGGATPAALTADILTSIYDQNVAVHLPRETIATTVEAAALNMLLDLFHLPRADWGIGKPAGHGGGSGTFTTGATASNVLGLALGREYVLATAAHQAGKPDMSVAEHGIADVMAAAGLARIQVLSTMPHSSLRKAASIVGIGRANVVSIAQRGPDDGDGDGDDDALIAIDFARLETELRRPRTANILVVSAGEVNTGRFATSGGAELARLCRLCRDAGAWIHVDGAFGLFGRVLAGAGFEGDEGDEFRDVVLGTAGLEAADSITGDAHKLLNVPYDCGFFFTRHKDLAERVCRNSGAAYLTPPAAPAATAATAAAGGCDGDGDGVQSPLNIGLENSRRFRALPVYATLVRYGRTGYVDMLVRQVRLARRVAAFVFDHDGYELLPRATAAAAAAAAGGGKGDEEDEKRKRKSREVAVARTFMVVLFRARDERVNAELVARVNATGRIYVSGTVWEGRPAARIAVSNWRVDVERDVRLVQAVLGAVLLG